LQWNSNEAPLQRRLAMHTICCNIALLSVTSIFYTWRAYAGEFGDRQRTIRGRVAYMLWVAAQLAE
jgi:hypothetical protein